MLQPEVIVADAPIEDLSKEEVIPEAIVDTPSENEGEYNLDLSEIEKLLEMDTTKDKEIQTEPKFFKEEEKKVEEEDEYIDEELLNELDNSFEELENNLKLSNEEKDLIAKEKDELDKLLEDTNNKLSKYTEGFDKLGDHPILGPLNAKLLRGEEINIPEYLENLSKEEIDSLPDMQEIPNEPSGNKGAMSLQDKLSQRAKNRY